MSTTATAALPNISTTPLSISVLTRPKIWSKSASSNVCINRSQEKKDDLQNPIAFEVKTISMRLQAALKEIEVADAELNPVQQQGTQTQERV
jgi:hypothetical protein